MPLREDTHATSSPRTRRVVLAERSQGSSRKRVSFAQNAQPRRSSPRRHRAGRDNNPGIAIMYKTKRGEARIAVTFRDIPDSTLCETVLRSNGTYRPIAHPGVEATRAWLFPPENWKRLTWGLAEAKRDQILTEVEKCIRAWNKRGVHAQGY